MAAPIFRHHHTQRRFPSHLKASLEEGAFLCFEPTRIELRSTKDNLTYIWTSRRHRKARSQRKVGARAQEEETRGHRTKFFGWQPRSFSYWTGIMFFIGSLIFVFAGIMGVIPYTHRPENATWNYLHWSSIPSLTGATLFIGGTTLQFLEVINEEREVDLEKAWEEEKGQDIESCSESPDQLRQEASAETSLIGFRPHRLDYWAAVIMWIGSILFEVNSVLLVVPSVYSNIVLARKYIWSFSTAGAAMFLLSGYMQLIEDGHAFWKWRPRSLGFWATFNGTLGGLFFTIASIFGFWTNTFYIGWLGVNIGFLVGSLCFLVNSYCVILERVNP